MSEDRLIPLINIHSSSAIKITSMQYSSPPIIDAQGVISSMIDLAYAGTRNQRDEEAFINEQIGQTAENVTRLVRTAQVVNDHRTPQYVKFYANNVLVQLLEQQERVNKKLDIRIDHIDTIG